jgi:serpin B
MELTRRTFGGILLGALLASCGSDAGELEISDSGDTTPTTPPSEGTPVTLPMRDVEGGDPQIAGAVISRLSDQLFSATRDGANHTISPASIGIALAMLELGTSGEAMEEVRALFGIGEADIDAFHQSMGALEVSLEELRDGLTFRLANSAYIQQGFPFEDAFLQSLGTSYGAALVESDFINEAELERAAINEWVEEQTEGFIPDLLPEGSVHGATVLVLVNALYLLATWETEFDPSQTTEHDFTRQNGSTVTVDMLRGNTDASWQGDGFVAGEKRYDGGLLAQFVLPDDGRFDEIATALDASLAARPEFTPAGGALFLPKFETRSDADLIPALQANGLSGIFRPGGLERISTEGGLIVDGAIHQTYVSFDEKGTEAAAATAITVETLSAAVERDVDVILDRPFLYRIVDAETNATLFVGQVMDPTAG